MPIVDPKVWYWTGAWLNMFVIVALAFGGVRAIRRGEVRGHRRRMLTAIALVGAFLGSYVLKLIFLGREDLDAWAPAYVWILRFHELCVAAMVLGGGTAFFLGQRLRLVEARDGSRGKVAPDKIPGCLALHRRAGRTALYTAIAGFLSSALVLFGMWSRY